MPTKHLRFIGDEFNREPVKVVLEDEQIVMIEGGKQRFEWPDGTQHDTYPYLVAEDTAMLRRQLGIIEYPE